MADASIHIPRGDDWLSTSLNIRGGLISKKEKVDDEVDLDQENFVDIIQRLQELQAPPKAPFVHSQCSCQILESPCSRAKAKVYSSDVSDDSDTSSSEEQEDFVLSKLLNTLHMFAVRTPNKMSSTLKNLAQSYHGNEDVGEQQLEKLMNLLQHENLSVKEGTLYTIRQLCRKESNAKKFVGKDLVNDLLYMLELETTKDIHDAVAAVLEQVASFESVADMWIDLVMTVGLPCLLRRLTPDNPYDVRLSILGAMRGLAVHKNMAILFIDQAMPILAQVKEINSEFKEVYTEILARLVLHTDHTRSSVLDEDALPAVLRMIRQGPCGPQKQGLLFLSALCKSSYGLSAVLEDEMTPFIVAAVQESQCRKVRAAASEVLKIITGTKKITHLKNAMLQIEKHFFGDIDLSQGHSQGQRPQTPEPVKIKKETALKVDRAVGEVAKLAVEQICKEARVEHDKSLSVTKILLKPCIDTDEFSLKVIENMLCIITNVLTLPINRPKCHLEGAWEEAADFKNKQLRVNSNSVKVLLASGALCLIDLLYVYTEKLQEIQRFHHLSNTSLNQDLSLSAKSVYVPALAQEYKTGDVTGIFETSELQLIKALLETLKYFALCSSEVVHNHLEEEVKLRMLNHRLISKSESSINGSGDANSRKMKSPRKAWTEADMNSKVYGVVKEPQPKPSKSITTERIWDPKNPFLTSSLFRDPVKNLEQEYKERMKREIGAARRHLRRVLYEGGVITAVAPWIVISDPDITSPIFDLLRCFIQPLDEKILPHPPSQTRQNGVRRHRPVSAHTVTDHNAVLNRALHQMSSSTAALVKEALGPRPKSARPYSAKGRMQKGGPGSDAESDELSWKPQLDVCQPIAKQCRDKVLEICGPYLMRALTSRFKLVRKGSVLFIQDIVNLGDNPMLLELSRLGCMSKLVAFLRINDDDELLEVIGLIVTRMLINSDPRLKKVFSYHGGASLLVSMATSTTGVLREEVAATLKTVNRDENKETIVKQPDIWDQILQRWKMQNKVSKILGQWCK